MLWNINNKKLQVQVKSNELQVTSYVQQIKSKVLQVTNELQVTYNLQVMN